jgi:hypothetical protein
MPAKRDIADIVGIMRSQAAREAETAASAVANDFATVVGTDPLRIELHATGMVLDSEDLYVNGSIDYGTLGEDDVVFVCCVGNEWLVVSLVEDPDDAAASGKVPVGLPPEGAAGELLAKASGDDFDAEWVPAPDPPPPPRIAEAYAMTAGYTKDRAFNPQATSLDEVAAVLATFLDDAIAAGLIRP